MSEISRERIETSMDLMAMMVIEELVQREGKDEDEMIVSFLQSQQGEMLYDDSTKTWWSGPSEISEQYEAARNTRSPSGNTIR